MNHDGFFPDTERLEEALGYSFRNPRWLTLALTHRSAAAEHNERLEFLGDALLEAIISIKLFSQYQQYNEGQLSRVRTSLVSGQSLTHLAHRFDLGKYLILGMGERKSGGRFRDSILADAIEALIAAIYLDGDFEQCSACVLRWFAEDLSHLPNNVARLKDPKSRLQEYLQSHNAALPAYAIISASGPDHARHFRVACTALGKSAEAEGSSRKIAEQSAAEALLAILKQEEHS